MAWLEVPNAHDSQAGAVLAQGQEVTIGGKISALSGMTLTLSLADGSLKTVSLLPVFSPELWNRVRKGQYPKAFASPG